MRSNGWIAGSILAAAMSLAAPVMAEDEKPKEVTTKQITNVTTTASELDGLSVAIQTGLILSLSNANSVFGQLDGSTYNFGLKFDGNVTYKSGKHEWRNVVALNTALTQTPAVDALIKSADTLVVDTTYLYFVRKWFGPFARVSASMPILRGFEVRPGPTDYAITRISGETDTILGAPRLDLTGPFRPAVVKETVGPFARVFQTEPIVVETRLGAGGLQIFADKQLAITDDPTTPVVEVQELKTVLQVGGEAAIDIEGVLFKKKVKYKAGAAALVPFWSNADAEGAKSGFDLMNVDLGGTVSIAMLEWASLDYGFRIQRQPQLTDQWQIRHGMTITIGPSFERKPAKPAKPKPKLPLCTPCKDVPAADAPKEAPAQK